MASNNARMLTAAAPGALEQAQAFLALKQTVTVIHQSVS